MKNVFKAVIEKGNYDLTDLLKKIDTYHIEGKITDGEKDELIGLARGGADAKNGVDVFAKLVELENRIKELEKGNNADDTEEYPQYVVGKWYYKGDRIAFKGERYVCVAPDGTVCTWSPTEYPAYWEKA